MRTIIGLGEVLWDIFPDEKRPGGAPANVAYHANLLGNEGVIVSAVGTDALGQRLVEWLASKSLRTDFIQKVSGLPTGTVQVTMEAGEPSYAILEGVAWENLFFNADLENLARRADAVCFGSLAQRSPQTAATIQSVLQACPGLKVFDVNQRPPFFSIDIVLPSLILADVVKMNRDEAQTIAEMFGQSDVCTWLLNDLNVQAVCLTRGKDGAVLYTKEGAYEAKGESVDTSGGDAVGVGDAFIAAMTTALLRNLTGTDALMFANRYAGMVATQRGGMPVLARDFLADFRKLASTMAA